MHNLFLHLEAEGKELPPKLLLFFVSPTLNEQPNKCGRRSRVRSTPPTQCVISD